MVISGERMGLARPDVEGDGDLAEAAARIRKSRRVLAVTGAGVSAESGVPTFRGQDGLWRQFRAEDLATPQAFARDPRLVWEWYAWRRELIAPARPNAAHVALAALERNLPSFLLATQNVDGLHSLAGSRKLVELHGSLWRMRCVSCAHAAEDRSVPLPELPPRCACGAILRPDVTWFGEMLRPRAVEKAVTAARCAEVVLVIGTSSIVYPAAALPEMARAAGGFVIEVNTEPTPLTVSAHLSLRGRASEILPPLVAEAS